MDLSAGVESMKGIGPQTAELLAAGGVRTLRDLLYYLPRDYEDYAAAGRIADLRPGKVVLRAQVESVKTLRKRRNLAITTAMLRDDSGSVRAVWFNQAYREKQFEPGRWYYFSGEFGLHYQSYSLSNPSAVLAEEVMVANGEKFVPVYPARGRLKSGQIGKFIKVLQPVVADVRDLVPDFSFGGSRAEALYRVHFPEDAEEARVGREYLATEELFVLMLAAGLNAQENQKLRAEVMECDLGALKKLVTGLPFALTGAQRRALWEIIQDLGRKVPMNRLLQGDVGSGKTLVAALAAFVAGRAGCQTALLAPTEILATQHAESLHKLLGDELRIALLTGATKNKRELRQRIRAGEVDLVIGTHALLTDDTGFRKLGLVIIDEQHRFGVAQRQKLLAKSGDDEMPHFLAMTATPIPRSLQLTVLGDLDVSVLDELPKGRQEIKTQIVSPNSLAAMWQAVEMELNAGHQAYYVCKMIEEGTELSSVKTETEKIRGKLKQWRVEYLHGRMKAAEKEAIMAEFAAGKIDVLVSTTVVEVGVDVPNATVMVIADADRYGLSQLHQLRGRVGRGTAASFCYLVSSTSDRPTRRMREIERSADGFHLAEVDLQLRGPGEIYGALQHGALDLRIATLSDMRLVNRAQKLVKEFLASGKSVIEYEELASAVRKYQKLTTLN